MNGFIKYLNSMNSAKSESMNALAESQLMSNYYSKIEVKRDISKKITEYLMNKDKHEAIILTGHAGDGKTSILVQVLDDFGYFENDKKPLKVEDEFDSLYYIKDMSELSLQEQKDLLLKFLKCKEVGKSAIIVSNTGPIINTFKALCIDDVSKEEMEKKILKGIDNTISDKIVVSSGVNEYTFRMVNLANIDNSYMIEQILRKLLDKTLWEDCFNCESKAKCPIYNNYCDLEKNFLQVAEQIGKIYFWLSERGSRLTIRQMLAHFTFSLTSNLECENIYEFADHISILKKYSFVNGFFGVYGDTKLEASALNIKTIKELKIMGLDKMSFGKYDDEIFIKENFNIFHNSIQSKIRGIVEYSSENISADSILATNLRSEMRRYLMLFSTSNDSRADLDNVMFGEAFMDYYRAVTDSKEFSKASLRKINKIIFIALYRYFVGVYPMNDEEYLYITLRKDFNLVQNTQMLIARVPKDHIRAVLETVSDQVEPEKVKLRLVLKIGNSGRFLISAEFLEYMFKFNDGAVFTNLQPSFSYGISKLKTQILKEYKVDDDKLTLIVIQNDKVNKMVIEIVDNEIIVD